MKLMQALFLAAAILATAPVFAGQPVNVNTATAEELSQGLDGVGMSKAEAIVEYRTANGPFKHADELVNVKGIGLKTVDRNRDFIRLSEDAQPAKDRRS